MKPVPVTRTRISYAVGHFFLIKFICDATFFGDHDLD